MEQPMLTILTPTFDRRHTLPRLYDSLCAQARHDFEWLVVDDGSTDDTAQWVRACRPRTGFQVRVLRQDNSGKHVALKYRGPGGARRVGFSSSTATIG